MAWCFYGDDHLRRRVGVRLRVRDLPNKILQAAPSGEIIFYVRVVARRKGTATLEVVSHKPGEFMKRFTHSIVISPEDPKWVVER